MNALTAALKEELNVEMISLGGLQVPESVVVSWGIMLFLVIVSILLTRNLKVDHISRRQAILELVVTMIDNFFTGLLGEQGRRYVPYLMTLDTTFYPLNSLPQSLQTKVLSSNIVVSPLCLVLAHGRIVTIPLVFRDHSADRKLTRGLNE